MPSVTRSRSKRDDEDDDSGDSGQSTPPGSRTMAGSASDHHLSQAFQPPASSAPARWKSSSTRIVTTEKKAAADTYRHVKSSAIPSPIGIGSVSRASDSQLQDSKPSAIMAGGKMRSTYDALPEISALRDDDIGPVVADCTNLGSWAEESPPRRRSRLAQQQHKHPQPPPPPPPYYGGGPSHPYYAAYRHPGYHHPPYPYYPPRPYQEPWASPPAYDNPTRKPPPEGPSSPPHKRARTQAAAAQPPQQQTPEKGTPLRGPPNPFRSPPPSKGSSKGGGLKKSPLFQGTPSFGLSYGSFGMDTPGGTALDEEFSPMAPSFASFDRGDTTIELVGGDPLDNAKLRLSDSSSSDEAQRDANRPASSVIRPREVTSSDASPFNLMAELSPFAATAPIPGSPLRSSSQTPADASRHIGSVPEAIFSKSIGSKPSYGTSSPDSSFESKMSPPSSTKSNKAGRPVRLELGDLSTKSLSKRLEGINSMVRGPEHARQPTPSPAQRGSVQGRQTPVSVMRTSRKMTPTGLQRTPAPSRMPPSVPRPYHKPPHTIPPSAHRYGVPPASASKLQQHPPPMIAGHPTPTPRKGLGGKGGTPGRRSPCNCKKSKCLKLYCECFAAERYCDGCNCNDCRNSKQYEDQRTKAIKETRAKNPNFKARIAYNRAVQQGTNPQQAHNMGCKCKKSECLKKYCECFQNGVMCGSKCKCQDCLNYVGSQALIDKRRKMKDHRGADIAMRAADDAWKGKAPTPHPPPTPKSTASSTKRGPPSSSGRPMPAPAPAPGPPPPPPPPPGGRRPANVHRRLPPHYSSSSNHPPPRHGPPPPPGYAPPPHYMGHPMGYPSPMTPHPARHPSYHPPRHQYAAHPRGAAPPSYPASKPPPPSKKKRPPPPRPTAPRTPAVRTAYDAHSSKKKRRIQPGAEEEKHPFFGSIVPQQPKTTALAVFSFLSNDELYNAGLVCKRWSRLAIDEELWKF